MNSLRFVRVSLRQTRQGIAESEYELVVLNVGGRPASLKLEASGGDGELRFVLPREVTVPPGSERIVGIVVSPVRRRWFGSFRSLPFAVTAAPAEDVGSPPLSASAAYADQPRFQEVRPLLTLAAVGIIGVVLVIGLLALWADQTGDSGPREESSESDSSAAAASTEVPTLPTPTPRSTAPRTPTPLPPVSPNYTLTGSLQVLGDTRISPPLLCYHLEPENVPFRVRLLVSVNGGNPVSVDGWDDDGVNGGGCVFVSINPLPGETAAVSMEAYVNGVRVGQASLGEVRN